MKYLPVALLLIAPLLSAGTIYKYTDANGNIAYSNSKPHNIESEAVAVEQSNQIETDNKSQEYLEQSYRRDVRQSEIEKKSNQDKQAKRNTALNTLKDAEKALEDAKTIRDGDMHPLPKGGVRYTDQYRNRIEAAEKAVDDAKNL